VFADAFNSHVTSTVLTLILLTLSHKQPVSHHEHDFGPAAVSANVLCTTGHFCKWLFFD